MKVKEIIDKFGELETEELLTFLEFIVLVSKMNSEDQKTTTDFFEIISKKIDENFVKRKEKKK